MNDSSKSPLQVIVATPLGRGGMGGIDRMMDALEQELSIRPIDGLSVRFGATRGKGALALSVVVLARFVILMLIRRVFFVCDLVHVNLSADGSTWRKVIVVRVVRLLGLPYVLHLHASRYQAFYQSLGMRRRNLVRWLFQGAATVIVLGESWRDFVVRENLAHTSRVVVLPNATPIREHAVVRDGGIVVLFLGRIGARKGVPQLLAALDSLRDVSGWRAVLAGDGDVEAFRAQATQFSDRVKFPGWLDAAETDALLGSSSILVLPSFAENLPMSVIEGMAAGLAIIATPVGAIPEILQDGVTGLIVPVGDVDALANALQRLIENRELRERLGAAARQFHREHLAIENYAQRIAEVWHAATSKP